MNVLRFASYLFLALILAFSLTVALLLFGELRAAKSAADMAALQRAALAANYLKARVEAGELAGISGFSELRDFARKHSLKRVLFMNAGGRPTGDSRAERIAKKPRWFPPGGADAVIKGGGEYSINFTEGARQMSAHITAARGADGRMVLVAAVAERPFGDRMLSERAFWTILISVALFWLVYIVLRLYGRAGGGQGPAGRARRRKRRARRGASSQTPCTGSLRN